ncbi:MAG: 7-cyano-7-deazaguanine synthase [Bryobacteraceae bacterium]
MDKVDHLVLCGGASGSPKVKSDQTVRLDLSGDDPNVDLEIVNISRRLSSDVPDVIVDLIEIASYVYCADQAVTRGGEGVLVLGAGWRRHFIFHIPVRLPDIWSSAQVMDALKSTLSFLSDDEYDFRFERRHSAVPIQQYLRFGDGDSEVLEIERVLLFSGGLDSLGGAAQESVLESRRVALVSHRSNPRLSNRQARLIQELHAVSNHGPPLHVPVWVHQRGAGGREYTQRSRSFLYASLAFAVARVFGLDRIRFYENGVVSLNPPISEQAIGGRATRTTHPQVLYGFAKLFSHLIQQTFAVENPFLWRTRAELVNLIGDAGCGELIQHSVSCVHTREQTKEKSHCGRCSQCVGRRFATLASRYAESDPEDIYKVDLLKGDREADKDLTLVESFIRTALEMKYMADDELIARYAGEFSRVARHVPGMTADQVAFEIAALNRKHGSKSIGL